MKRISKMTRIKKKRMREVSMQQGWWQRIRIRRVVCSWILIIIVNRIEKRENIKKDIVSILILIRIKKVNSLRLKERKRHNR